ncbi:unnamed protein product [Bemisia tabaci]|uniref:RGS domain-containing protein n=1 Tax=Bemisia tabaci TaxID=7038 RepID=A0A9P0AHY2_BEMTA|nr:PREDICTED: uncharacterized protein LOC109034461 [Bemisia tabaci]CAH0391962.1 unnamed protein product [Bemisia tabaci]
MSCVPCCPNEDFIPQEELDRWTDDIHHVLNNREGTRRFHEFLVTRGLDESELTLEFWERCSRSLDQLSASGSPPDTRHSVEVMRFHKEVKDLLSFAEENVNFDLAQMKIFYEAVKSANVDKLKTVVAEAMESAVNLLDDDYQLFRRHLLRERNLLKSR